MPAPSRDEVHVWIVPLSSAPDLRHLLSADERERLHRYRCERDRSLYAVAHGALRLLLGDYLGVDGRGLRFDVGSRGKPMLSPRRLTFNLSHSGDFAVVAVGLALEVGVDIEKRRPDARLDELARSVMTSSELGRYWRLALKDRTAYFYDVWTSKEALLKASGAGLGRNLTSVASEGYGGYTVRPFPLAGYSAAVAGTGANWTYELHHMPRSTPQAAVSV